MNLKKHSERTAEYKTIGEHPALNQELIGSSDRVAVLLGATIVDTHLERLLSKFFVRGLKESKELLSSSNASAPLLSFSARTKIAYCLGLIEKTEFEDLNKIREIRNAFAHNLFECDFSTKAVSDALHSMHLIKHYRSQNPELPVRVMFTLTIAMLESKLTFRIKQTNAREVPFHIQPPGAA